MNQREIFSQNMLMSILFWLRKCTFSPYILAFFHFGLYIFISPLLVPKPINMWHLSLTITQLTEKVDVANSTIKIIIKKPILALKNATSASKLKNNNLLILNK